VKPVKWLLPNAEAYQEWEENQNDEDIDFIDLYESSDEGGNGSEDSDNVYEEEEIVEYHHVDMEGEQEDMVGEQEDIEGEQEDVKGEQEDVEGEQEDVEGWEEGDDDVHMTDEGEPSSSGSGSRMRDLGWPDSSSSSRGLDGDAAEDHFRASTQEIGEQLLGLAITPKDIFTSPEDQQDSIETIFNKRKYYLAGNARLIIDLEAATREDAEEQAIDIEDIDRIDRVKQELED